MNIILLGAASLGAVFVFTKADIDRRENPGAMTHQVIMDRHADGSTTTTEVRMISFED